MQLSRRDLLLGGLGLAGMSAIAKPTRSAVASDGTRFSAIAKTPSSSLYVQDGLVAMWDAIENIGPGQHDATSTIWKDLIGNADFKCETGSVSDSWIRYSKSVQITIENPLVTDYPFTIQGVYDRTETFGNFSAFGFGFSSGRLCTGNASSFGCRFGSAYNTMNVVGPRNAITWLRSSADGENPHFVAVC